ncbi:uncharacterized protein LOC125033700 isoform X2 [Penaeus chinensis]|uniref:uncharacterized protein LOC125033700 isoform X2 n=1 Tax=Penaeus chinensis TaxID=139456 RepID=UPI001FB85727|nr:uncharacterized protein LOC125033700 isoform X2 [Penaeus chinensis]
MRRSRNDTCSRWSSPTRGCEFDEEESGSKGEREDPIPRLLFRGYVELATARIHKVMINTGILEVESDLIAGASAKVFFQRAALYLTENKAKRGHRLCNLLRNRLTEPCGCVARPFTNKRGTFKRITGVEVHLIAKKVWIGKRSSSSAVSGRGPQKGRALVSSNDGQEAGPAASGLHASSAALGACGALRGEVSFVAGSTGILKKADGCCRAFFADQCFLYGVCLQDVRLEDVLRKGKKVFYKMSDDGLRVRSVLLGSSHCTKMLDSDDLYFRVKNWCQSNCIPQDTTNILLCLAGWLPVDLNPTIDQREYKEVVDASNWPGQKS